MVPREAWAGDNIPQGVLLARLASERARVDAADGVMTKQETRQYARVLLLLTCYKLFESRGGNTAHLWWLPYLRRFDRMYNFDWGGFILAVMYDAMDHISRHMTLNLKGFSLLWEV